ncbi:MAG TPA: LuxR C-terminal-related transcriptional regulator [Ignavibacteriales bacterium]|nr:LuxR C-terminal-related transcriptional regulator [Ignavibacteriales bacterium]
MKNKKFNIVIAEPSCIIFEGLSGILGRQNGLQFIIHKADGLSELSQIIQSISVDFVLINPVLVQNQTKLFYSIKKLLPEAYWIAIAYSLFDQQLMSQFDSVITVNDSPSQIADLLAKLLNSRTGAEKEIQTGTLSDRETEVLKLLVTGNSNREIAEKLFISPHTVITHRKNISQKTGIKSVSGLTIFAVVNNIIELDKLNG